jgi:hypothetical protein
VAALAASPLVRRLDVLRLSGVSLSARATAALLTLADSERPRAIYLGVSGGGRGVPRRLAAALKRRLNPPAEPS